VLPERRGRRKTERIGCDTRPRVSRLGKKEIVNSLLVTEALESKGLLVEMQYKKGNYN